MTAPNELLAQALGFRDRYEAAIRPCLTEGGEVVQEERYPTYDESRADYGEEAVELLRSFAALAPHSPTGEDQPVPQHIYGRCWSA